MRKNRCACNFIWKCLQYYFLYLYHSSQQHNAIKRAPFDCLSFDFYKFTGYTYFTSSLEQQCLYQLGTKQPWVEGIQVFFFKWKAIEWKFNYIFYSSPELKFKWAFLMSCPYVNYSQFHFLLHNCLTSFNQTSPKASLGDGDSSLWGEIIAK